MASIVAGDTEVQCDTTSDSVTTPLFDESARHQLRLQHIRIIWLLMALQMFVLVSVEIAAFSNSWHMFLNTGQIHGFILCGALLAIVSVVVYNITRKSGPGPNAAWWYLFAAYVWQLVTLFLGVYATLTIVKVVYSRPYLKYSSDTSSRYLWRPTIVHR
eukprot:TRINITY_DN26950_c0_g1_i1.p1 TRINITY_DN26950_c0_g1~~TRINITY_DN26950_c0_g1_i1.p1  ORF type:complete len:182 (-),score=0.62 TRINITY_DN26950_c0_g1_i1:102-578(-)